MEFLFFSSPHRSSRVSETFSQQEVRKYSHTITKRDDKNQPFTTNVIMIVITLRIIYYIQHNKYVCMLFTIGKGIGWGGVGGGGILAPNKEKNNNNKNEILKKVTKSNKRRVHCFMMIFHRLCTQTKKKYLGVFTGQAYTVVYATVKYLLYHPYIENESRHRKNVTINNGIRCSVK